MNDKIFKEFSNKAIEEFRKNYESGYSMDYMESEVHRKLDELECTNVIFCKTSSVDSP